jgi:hypothetical protein
MTSPPIRPLLEWHARQFFCRMGATCESKPGGLGGHRAANHAAGDSEDDQARRTAFITDRQFHGSFRIES